MQKNIAIIGGGIVGSTAAYYLSRQGQKVTLFDESHGQATKAAAGIICPWFSLRRNKPWYFLVSNGAEFYQKLMKDLNEDGIPTESIFEREGAIFIRKNASRIQKDLIMAEDKLKTSPSIQKVYPISAQEISQRCPHIQTDYDGIFVQGGARVDGLQLIENLQKAAEQMGAKIIREKAKISHHSFDNIQIQSVSYQDTFSHVLLSAGAWLPSILEPLGYKVDLNPQKGQLFTVKNSEWANKHWPVIIPFGQGDIIPFNNGQITIGATHEDEQGFDLTVDLNPLSQLKAEAQHWMPSLSDYTIESIRVGTRAQTSDYSVIVGPVPNLHNIWTISGLGSSGLTSGPYLGYQWSQLIMQGQWNIPQSEFPIENYIKKTEHISRN